MSLDFREPTQKAWHTVLRRDPCAYCNKPSRDVDHIVPQILQGGYGPHNEIGVCRRCNAQKNSHSLLAFLSGLVVGHDHHTRTARIHEAGELRRAAA